jgi:hypothetical protein
LIVWVVENHVELTEEGLSKNDLVEVAVSHVLETRVAVTTDFVEE